MGRKIKLFPFMGRKGKHFSLRGRKMSIIFSQGKKVMKRGISSQGMENKKSTSSQRRENKKYEGLEKCISSGGLEITINSPLLYIGRGIIILLRKKPLRGPFQGVLHENQDFQRGPRLFWPLKWHKRRRGPFCGQKSRSLL